MGGLSELVFHVIGSLNTQYATCLCRVLLSSLQSTEIGVRNHILSRARYLSVQLCRRIRTLSIRFSRSDNTVFNSSCRSIKALDNAVLLLSIGNPYGSSASLCDVTMSPRRIQCLLHNRAGNEHAVP